MQLAQNRVTKLHPVSGGASAVKEPGHFEVRKSSSQVRSRRVPDAAKGSPAVHTITEAKQ